MYFFILYAKSLIPRPVENHLTQLSPRLLARYLPSRYVYLHSTLALRLAVEDDQAWGQDQVYGSMPNW